MLSGWYIIVYFLKLIEYVIFKGFKVIDRFYIVWYFRVKKIEVNYFFG